MGRLQYWRFEYDGIRALEGLWTHVAKSGLESAVLDLVYLRVSQLNGCSYSVDAHGREAIEHGVAQRLVNDVAARRDTPFFTDRQRAALAWAEVVTDIAATRAPDDVYHDVAAQFSESELVNLTLAIAHMNAFNRLAIAFRRGPDSKPG